MVVEGVRSNGGSSRSSSLNRSRGLVTEAVADCRIQFRATCDGSTARACVCVNAHMRAWELGGCAGKAASHTLSEPAHS